MAQTPSYNILNAAGAIVRQRLNEVILALATANSGSTAPPSPGPGTFWLDTSAALPVLRIRNAGNTAWLALFTINADATLSFAGALTSNPAQARQTLDVAQRQSGPMDDNTGRGLILGAFGLGGNSGEYTASDLNALTRGGFWQAENPANAPGPGTYVGLSSFRTGGNGGAQIAINIGTGDIHIRRRASGAFGPWVQLNRQDLGEGQVWTAVDRSVNTVYQNTTGRSIMVSIHSRGNGSPQFQVSTDGSNWLTLNDWPGGGSAGSNYERSGFSTVIPHGTYYRMLNGSFDYWRELR